MADKSVIDFTEITDVDNADVLYVVRGLDSTRDKQSKKGTFLQNVFYESQLRFEDDAVASASQDTVSEVISGLEVIPNTGMTLFAKSGVAVSFEGSYLISNRPAGTYGWFWNEASGHFACSLVEDALITVPAADAIFSRIDTIEIRPTQAVDAKGNISFSSEVRLLEGVPNNSTAAESSQFTFADDYSAFGGKYLTFDLPGGVQYYAWWDVDNGNTDPLLPGKTGIEVDLSSVTHTSPTLVCQATADAIDAAVVLVSVLNIGADMGITNIGPGWVPDATIGDVDPTDLSVVITTQGGSGFTAPPSTAGWIKLAEVYVEANATTISSSVINTWEYSHFWSTDASVTQRLQRLTADMDVTFDPSDGSSVWLYQALKFPTDFGGYTVTINLPAGTYSFAGGILDASHRNGVLHLKGAGATTIINQSTLFNGQVRYVMEDVYFEGRVHNSLPTDRQESIPSFEFIDCSFDMTGQTGASAIDLIDISSVRFDTCPVFDSDSTSTNCTGLKVTQCPNILNLPTMPGTPGGLLQYHVQLIESVVVDSTNLVTGTSGDINPASSKYTLLDYLPTREVLRKEALLDLQTSSLTAGVWEDNRNIERNFDFVKDGYNANGIPGGAYCIVGNNGTASVIYMLPKNFRYLKYRVMSGNDAFIVKTGVAGVESYSVPASSDDGSIVVVMGYRAGSTLCVYRSSNYGETFTVGADIGGNGISNVITFCNGYFFITDGGSSGYAVSSPDGITWTTVTLPTNVTAMKLTKCESRVFNYGVDAVSNVLRMRHTDGGGTWVDTTITGVTVISPYCNIGEIRGVYYCLISKTTSPPFDMDIYSLLPGETTWNLLASGVAQQFSISGTANNSNGKYFVYYNGRSEYTIISDINQIIDGDMWSFPSIPSVKDRPGDVRLSHDGNHVYTSGQDQDSLKYFSAWYSIETLFEKLR